MHSGICEPLERIPLHTSVQAWATRGMRPTQVLDLKSRPCKSQNRSQRAPIDGALAWRSPWTSLPTLTKNAVSAARTASRLPRVDVGKARRKALMRPASTARISQRRLKPAAASTALIASPVAPFNQHRAMR